MKPANIKTIMMLAQLLIIPLFARVYAQTDPLPSWNDGPPRKQSSSS